MVSQWCTPASLVAKKGKDEGLGNYWTQWLINVAGIPDGGGDHSVFQYLFADEIRNAPLVATYVLEYDEADKGTEKHTWEWLLKKGRDSFQRKRERERDNQLQKQKVLQGANYTTRTRNSEATGPIDSALPAQDATRIGEHPNPRHQKVTDTTEQTPREKCWFWNFTGGCSKKNCPRDHVAMTDEEKSKAPGSFWEKDKRGHRRDQGVIQKAVTPKKEKGKENRSKSKAEGKGTRIAGCKWTNNNETCPRGDKCHWAWAHDRPRGPPQIFDRKAVSDRRKEGTCVKDDTSEMGSAFSAGSSSGSDVDRGVKPTNAE
jgi:hypothetical protein